MVDGQTSSQLAEELARLGHSVHVLAPFPSRPAGKVYLGYKRKPFSTSDLSARLRLTRCFNTVSAKSTILSRLAENLSFGVSAGLKLLVDSRPDVIYSNTWPIFASGIVAFIARLRRIPLVLSIQDVYPESLVSQRRIGGKGALHWFLRQCDRLISHAAREVVVISSGFRRLYEANRGVDPDRVHLIPNWNDDSLFDPVPSAACLFRRKLNIPEEAFVVVCAGNIGVACYAEILVQALASLRDRRQIYLVIAGDGARLDACRSEIDRSNLDRAVIHSPWKIEDTGAVLQMADVLALPTRGEQSLASIPSKLIGYLLSARPVIAGVLPESDTARTIVEAGAGWVVDPVSADAMAKSIAQASETPRETLHAMGLAGRKYATRHLTRAANLPSLIRIVENAAGARQRKRIGIQALGEIER